MTNTAPGIAAQAFSDEEYDRRWSATEQQLADWGVDAVTVTAPTHIQWLTGHDAGGSYAAPYFLIVAPGQSRRFIVRRYDERTVRDSSISIELVTYYGRFDCVDVWADQLREMGLHRGRLGLELDCWGLAPADVARLEALLPELTIVDTSRLILNVCEVKSSEEIEAMRAAAAVTDVAVEAFWNNVVEGRTELDSYLAIQDAIRSAGCANNAFTLLFGANTALPHGYPTENALRRGEVAFIEVGASRHGYTAGICRTAVLGRHPRAEELHRIAEEATAATISALRPGMIARDVHAVAQSVVDGAGRGATMRQRTGYGIGINWYDRGYLSLDPGSEQVIAENVTIHMPRILFDESGEFGVGTSETVLVTAEGAEPLGRTPGTLRLV